MKFLLLLVGTVAAVAAIPREFPCPLAADIYPCVCSVGTTGEPDLDCSDVTSNNVLAAVFQAPFPFTQFNNFIIIPDAPHGAFDTIAAFVFGDVSFRNVTIRNTYIATIQEGAFAPSHDSLISLECSGSYLQVFPVETLPLFIHLRILSLANNKLPTLPNFESDSLLSLDLSQNIGLTLTETTLVGLKQLEELYLSDMGFTSLPPNLFSSLTFLRILDLSNNGMAGTLAQGVIHVSLDSVEDLRLNDNAITQIHSSAITGEYYHHTITTGREGQDNIITIIITNIKITITGKTAMLIISTNSPIKW